MVNVVLVRRGWLGGVKETGGVVRTGVVGWVCGGVDEAGLWETAGSVVTVVAGWD